MKMVQNFIKRQDCYSSFWLVLLISMVFLAIIAMVGVLGCHAEKELEVKNDTHKNDATDDNDSDSKKPRGYNDDGYRDIDRNGHFYGDTDNDQKSYIIFSFDDGNSTDYRVVYPLLEARELKGVVYINPDFQDRGRSCHMTWKQVKKLDEAGWDIECHSYSHANLQDLEDKEIEMEMNSVDNAFKANDLDPPEHHAFPYGYFDERVQEIVGQHRITQRTTMDGINTYPYNLEKLKSVCMCYNVDTLNDYVDEVTKKGGLLIFYTHDVQEEPYEWGIEKDKFIEVLDYSISKDVEIVTMSEFMEREKLTPLTD